MSEWVLEEERIAARFKSEYRETHVELANDELCIGTQESFRGSYDNTASFIPLEVLRALLGKVGLRIVTEKDAAVLDAMRAIPDGTLQWFCGLQKIITSATVTDALKAELARRGVSSG